MVINPYFSDFENSILCRESPDVDAEFDGKTGERMECRHRLAKPSGIREQKIEEDLNALFKCSRIFCVQHCMTSTTMPNSDDTSSSSEFGMCQLGR